MKPQKFSHDWKKKYHDALRKSGRSKEDVLQACYLIFLRGPRRGIKSLDLYLSGVLKNIIKEYYKSQKIRATRELGKNAAVAPSPTSPIRHELIAEIRRLNYKRDALNDFIKYYLGEPRKSTKELAKERRVVVGTIHKQFNDIRRLMRENPRLRELYEELGN